MSELNLAEYKEKLIAERDKVRMKISGKGLTVDENETQDPVDLAAQNYSKNILISVSENDSRLLQQIEDALLRIDDEEFGNCLNCGNLINPKRLNAIPWAKYCISCQELLEKGLLGDEDE